MSLRSTTPLLRAVKRPFRVVATTAILGYGFPESSFRAAMAEGPVDLIAVDAGSIDPGPYYLATKSSFTALEHVVRDLRVMVQGYLEYQGPGPRPKLVVGSAGGCGTNNQVDILAAEVRRLLFNLGGRELSEAIPIATVTSELFTPAATLAHKQLVPLGPQPGGDTGRADLEPNANAVVVAQMGMEPIMAALEEVDIVLCGRAYDPAVFAAEPVRQGYPPASALHAAKILECGAIATVPGSGSDCLVADLQFNTEAASFWAPNMNRHCTVLSVAAHTLYEKSHPHLFGMPGGYLDTTATTFTQTDARTVLVEGTTMHRTPPTVKLEGACVRGQRLVQLELIEQQDLEQLDKSKESKESKKIQESLTQFVYGINGVEQRPLNPDVNEEELGILISVKANKKNAATGKFLFSVSSSSSSFTLLYG